MKNSLDLISSASEHLLASQQTARSHPNHLFRCPMRFFFFYAFRKSKIGVFKFSFPLFVSNTRNSNLRTLLDCGESFRLRFEDVFWLGNCYFPWFLFKISLLKYVYGGCWYW